MSNFLSVLSTAWYSVILPLLALSVLVLVHELGHYSAARAVGVGIKEFAIGMGPKILSVTGKKTKIVYSIRLIPIGGFVSMVGEDEDLDADNAFNKKAVWKRLIVLAAGSAMNILLGFVLMAIVVSGAKGFSSTEILHFESWAESESTGLQVGDQIVKINNKKINIYYDLAYALIREGDEPVNVTVKRNGETLKIPNVKFPTATESGITFGSVDFRTKAHEKTFVSSIRQVFYQSLSTIDMVWSSFFDLITGRFGMNEMSGPIGVTQEIGKSAKEGSMSMLFLLTLVTMNLGIVNLLPLPALDGGRLVFLAIEFIRRKPVKPEYEGYVHLAGMVLLLLFMAVVTYKDIMKLLVK